MPLPEYVPERTALLLVDPYNDFASPGGKLWPRLEAVAEAVGLIEHLVALLAAARAHGVRVVVAPHHRWQPGDYAGWANATPYQLASGAAQVFARDTWGGSWRAELAPRPGEAFAKEHWGANGFTGTDLGLLLEQGDARDVIVVGLLANTCIETTARAATELGYRVTLVRDATEAFEPAAMHSAHAINGPTFAHAILTTDEVLCALEDAASRRAVAGL